MTPPTDTIPEAQQLADDLHELGFPGKEEMLRLITEAITKHFQRRLAECGDAKSIVFAFKHGSLKGGEHLEQMINLHTARAVGEATVLLKEQIRVADVAFQGLHERHNGKLNQLKEDVRPLLDALYAIGSYDEGATVTGSFDEPASAARARETLTTFLEKHPELRTEGTDAQRLPPTHTPQKLRDTE